jgi:hypothetical protein
MKKERVFILKVSVVLAVASLLIAAAVWGVIIWQLGRPYKMPFLTSLQTARATTVFTGRFLLTAVLVFIVAWFPVRSWLNRRGPGPGQSDQH